MAPRCYRQMKLLRFCFFASLFMCFFLQLASAGNLTTDAEALLLFKENTGNQDNKNLASWNQSNISSICTNWAGVICNNDSSPQRVVVLWLPGQSLSGQIPPNTLGKLDAVQNLSLGSNEFNGELPLDLANCTSLRRLLLQNNSFSGPLWASAFNAWPSLMEVDLSFNNFNGSIPQSITNVTSLQTLNLQNNSFSGPIPAITTSYLESFNVANNELNGTIPSSLSRFSATSFTGNEGLCGKPLENACPGEITDKAPSSSINTTKKPSKLSGGAIVGIVIGGACLLLLLFGLIARNKSNKSPSARVFDIEKVQRGEGNVQEGTAREAEEEEAIAIAEEKLVFVDNSCREAFDIEGLLRASAEVMGKGSLGTAYKAILLENDLVVVVKRLNFEYKADYKRHLDVLGQLHHPNLVPIKAWYFSKEEKLLVYDYIHGSLYNHLYFGEKPMDWETRLRVASTVANTLAYIHTQNVVHGNVRASNVLMDSDGEVYVTDYGLVPLASSLPVKNSGYTPREVTDLSKMTTKGDVYSFGVLLLELLTGRSPLPTVGRHNGVVVDLPLWVQSVVSEQWTAEVFDLEIMKFEYIQEEMMLLLGIALNCVSPSPDQRPSMHSLAISIESLRSSDDEASLPPS